MPFPKTLFLRRKVSLFAEIEKFRRAMSIAGGGGKRDVGTQMLELTVWGYANGDNAAKAFREELAKTIPAS